MVDLHPIKGGAAILLCHLMLLTSLKINQPLISRIVTQTNTHLSSKTLDLLILVCTSQLAKNVLSLSAILIIPNGSPVRVQS